MKKGTLGIQTNRSIADLPISVLMTPHGQQAKLSVNQDDTLTNALNKKFSDFMENRRSKNFIQKLKGQRGRNNPVSYQENFNFKEQWQLADKSNYKLNYNYLFPQKLIFRICNGIMLFLLIFQIWLLSIFRLFQYQECFWVFCYSLIVNLMDVGLKIFFIYWFQSDDKIKNQHKKIEIMDYFEPFLGNLFVSFYSILGISKVISDINNDMYLVMDFACIVLIYMRCEGIYKNFKILIVCSKYKPYMKIYDLMSNLFLLTHIFGVLIYGVSRFQPSQSYLTIIEAKGQMTWIDRYIYSIYFSSTTMLTVGYGDLLPSNIQEIAVVLIMQLFGIVMIGYINGQVGDVLCTLRKQRQSLQDDLTNSQKLSKSFRLNHSTSQKIRQYLINNRKLDEQLNVQDQNQLLSKISDQLRNQANLTNHINIIKQSLLFIYNFSKKTQIEVSYKLNKIIFSPNETIPQIMGKEKIYLISKGQVAIFLAKKNKKGKVAKKIIRTLSKKTNHDFHQNSFGHTALILGRPTQLKAFSKDFAICHTIERHDLLEALGMDSNDLERFHEMRAKYESCKNPQKQECPQFYSIRQHYSPNSEFVIKRYLKQKCSTGRKPWIRNREKLKMIVETFEEEEDLASYNDSSESSETNSSALTIIDPSKIKEEAILTEKQRQNKYKSAGSIKLMISNIRTRSYLSKYMNKKYQQKREELVSKFKSRELQQPFEVLKEYGQFFKHANVTNILKKCMLSNSLLQVINPVIQILPSFYNEMRSISGIFDARLSWQKKRFKTSNF